MIGNEIMIGANAVVTKSFKKDAVTIASIPAKVISEMVSRLHGLRSINGIE